MDYKWLTYLLLSIISFVILEKFAQYILKRRSSQNINVFCEQFSEQTEAGAYYYREIFEEVDITITVIPRIGDPDLYISYTNQPTYQLVNHDQSSGTCGVEELKSIYNTRPVYIGVYCYNSHVNCSFELYICAPIDSVVIESTPIKHSTKNLKSSGLKSTFLSLIDNLFVEVLSTLF